jgi:protein O-GlcNAc transferase
VTPAEQLSLALSHHRSGNLSLAEQLYRQVLAADPRQADAWHLLGVIAHQRGDYSTAVESIGSAVNLQPASAVFRTSLGSALGMLGRPKEAEACFREAIRLRPDYTAAYSNLGNALLDQARLQEAETVLREAVSINPDVAEAHNNLGNSLWAQGRPADAAPHYETAIRINPKYADAHCNLGIVLKQQGRHSEAVASFYRALQINPRYADAHANLGSTLQFLGRRREAVEHMRQALRIAPVHVKAHSSLLCALNYDPNISQAELLAEHRKFGELHDGVQGSPPTYLNVRDPDRRLRLGYVSPDFHHHAAAYFIEPMLAHHDRSQVEVFLYAEVPAPDHMTARFMQMGHHWRATWGMTHRQASELIRADQIDILVDLAGHTAHHGLMTFVDRPAPVQVAYLGYPNTTGMSAIRYRLTDAVLDPPDEPPLYTEQLVRLPAGYCCFQPPQNAPPVNALPATTTGRVTFGSLHTLAKLNSDVLDHWCRVLQALPESRVLIFRDSLSGEMRQVMELEFLHRGIAADRIELRHQVSREQGHLVVYHDIDIALDAFPWSGHTTTCEALWMGVPVITLRGRRHAGRLSSSVLTSAGHPEWIAENPDQTIDLAVKLAGDLPALARTRADLRAAVAASPLCDATAFTRGLEQTYRTLWRDWCKK